MDCHWSSGLCFCRWLYFFGGLYTSITGLSVFTILSGFMLLSVNYTHHKTGLPSLNILLKWTVIGLYFQRTVLLPADFWQNTLVQYRTIFRSIKGLYLCQLISFQHRIILQWTAFQHWVVFLSNYVPTQDFTSINGLCSNTGLYFLCVICTSLCGLHFVSGVYSLPIMQYFY